MAAPSAEHKRAVAGQAVHDLARDYVRLYGQVVSALETGGGGPSASEFLREQVTACGRLRAQVASQSAAIESARLEIALRERQALRQEQYLQRRSDELARLRELLELRTAWVHEQEGVAQLLPAEAGLATEGLPGSQPATQEQPTVEATDADDELAALQRKRDLLQDWVRRKQASPDDGITRLRAELQRVYRLLSKLQSTHERLRTDALYAESQINLRALGVDPETASATEVVQQIQATVKQMGRDLSEKRAGLAEIAAQARVAQADARGQAAAVRWLEGELAGQRAWRALGMADMSSADGEDQPAPQLPGLLRQLRQEDDQTAVAESELRGRQDQLRWLRGTRAGMESWSALQGRLSEAEVKQ